MKQNRKLVGKIFTIFVTALLIVLLFTPLLSFSSSIYSSVGGSSDSVLAKYVTPIDVISAHFATEEDLVIAEDAYDTLSSEIALTNTSDEAKEDELAASPEATRYYTILFTQTENYYPNMTSDEAANLIGAMNMYTYFSFGIIVLIVALLALLVLRCIFPTKKSINISANILSIVLFLSTVAAMFITLPMALETTYYLTAEIFINFALVPNPNFLFSGIFILFGLLSMILTLTTKGLKKEKKQKVQQVAA